jgi:hypothetical protein
MRLSLAALAGAAVVAGLAASAAPAQDTPPPVSSVAAPTPIAAYAGRLVWSEPDGTGSYRLVQRIGDGPVQALPIAARKVPFDVDLGPTSAGTVYAVYSRCHVDPTWSGTQQMPAYEAGKGCDVYKLDLSSMTEVRYTKVNASDGSEYWPSYWKGRLAFARAYDDDPDQPYLYVKTISSSAPSARQPGGSRGSAASTPLQIELYGTRLAFAWRYQADRDAPAYDLRMDTVGADHIRLDSTPGGGLSSTVLGWPSFERAPLLAALVRGRSRRLPEHAPFRAVAVHRDAAAARGRLARLHAGDGARPGHHVDRDRRQLDLRLSDRPRHDARLRHRAVATGLRASELRPRSRTIGDADERQGS